MDDGSYVLSVHRQIPYLIILPIIIVLIVMSFGCGIGAAILIWWGGKKSLKRKQDEIV